MRVTSTGHVEDIQNFKDKLPEFDSRSGDHLWIMITMFKCDPSRLLRGEQLLMDHENLLSTVGPGCFYCEKPYTPGTDKRRCKGDGGS